MYPGNLLPRFGSRLKPRTRLFPKWCGCARASPRPARDWDIFQEIATAPDPIFFGWSAIPCGENIRLTEERTTEAERRIA